MKVREISTLPTDTIVKLLNAIPFYKAVKKQSEEQYQELLNFSRIMQYSPGETVLSRGQMDGWSYFLIKGQLVVSLPDQMGRPLHINYVTPGEVFGDLSVYLKAPRTADVKVDDNCREAIVFGTDFSMFGQLLNFNIVTLATKLIYYRHTVQSLRWKLEMYRSKYPSNPLAQEHRNIKLYTGPKDCNEELHALHEQSVDFAKLLVKWNQEFGKLSVAEGQQPEPNIAI
jgi:hypothetical protein